MERYLREVIGNYLTLNTVAYAGFSKGGARKFEINKDLNENFPA